MGGSRSPFEVKRDNAEIFTVGCSRCRENLKFGNFTLVLDRLREKVELKCVPHVQHKYFCSFKQT